MATGPIGSGAEMAAQAHQSPIRWRARCLVESRPARLSVREPAIRSASSKRPRCRNTLVARRPAEAIRPSNPSPRTASNEICSCRTASAAAEVAAVPTDRGVGLRTLVRHSASREAGGEAVRRSVGFAGKFATLLDRIEPLNDLVEANQAVADEAGGDRAIALTNHRQNILGGMHRASHRGEVDDAGAAFEGVECTERAVQARTVVRLALQRKKVGRGLLDELARLHQKLFEELVHWGAPQNIAM